MLILTTIFTSHRVVFGSKNQFFHNLCEFWIEFYSKHTQIWKKFFFMTHFWFFSVKHHSFFQKTCVTTKILVVSVVTHVIFVKNDPKPSKMEVYCTSIQKIGVRPPPKGGGSLGKQYYYWFFGGPRDPFLGAIFTVIPFKILFLMIKWPFLNGVTMKMTPPEGQFSL